MATTAVTAAAMALTPIAAQHLAIDAVVIVITERNLWLP